MKTVRAVLLAAILVGGFGLAATMMSGSGPAAGAWSSIRERIGLGGGSTARPGASQSSAAAADADTARVQVTGLDELARRFYERRAMRAAWLEAKGPTPAARAMLEAIHRAADEGLDPADYPVEPIERTLALAPPDAAAAAHAGGAVARAATAPALSADQRASLDARMTTVFLHYASDLATGRVDPRAIHPDWHTPLNDLDVAEIVGSALDKDQVPGLLAALAPPHPEYARLRQALASLRAEAAAGETPRPAPAARTATRARKGARGRPAAPATPTPDLLPVAERIRRVTLSMERWRWVPRQLGNPSIVINIPAYRLDVLGGDRSLLSMRIVAGKAFSPTPVFSDTITSLVINPAWNIPDGIARDEILPAARRDPRYLEQKGIHALSGEGDKAREVDPASLREPAPGAHLPFVLRQDPGPENPLGRIKFLMPNKYDIYLHDTPAGQLFAKEDRAFSHGCIRVEKPVELAETLLQGTEWDRAKITEAMDAKETQEVRLVRPMPVHIVYMTAWVDEAGTLSFGDDVYALDPALEAMLSRSREERAALTRAAGDGDTGDR